MANPKKTRNPRVVGLLFVLIPPLIIMISLTFYAILTFVSAALLFESGDSAYGAMKFISFATGTLAVVAVLSLFVCIPMGIKNLRKELPVSAHYDKRSGKGGASEIPDEIKGWSWGAAGLNLIWGLYHRVWISLLIFVPVVNWVFWIVLGVKGNEWAWRKNKWESVEQFKKSQNKWKVWGIVFFILGALLSLYGVTHPPYQKSSTFDSSFYDNQLKNFDLMPEY